MRPFDDVIDRADYRRLLAVFSNAAKTNVSCVDWDDIPPPPASIIDDVVFAAHCQNCLRMLVANALERGFISLESLCRYSAYLRWALNKKVILPEHVLRLAIKGIIYLEQDQDMICYAHGNLVSLLFRRYCLLNPDLEAAMCNWIIANRVSAHQPFGCERSNYQPSMRQFEYSENVAKLNAKIRSDMEAIAQRPALMKHNERSQQYLPQAIKNGNLIEIKSHCSNVFFTTKNWLEDMILLAKKTQNADVQAVIASMVKRLQGR